MNSQSLKTWLEIIKALSRIFRGEPATQTLEVVRSKNIDAQEAAKLTTQKCCWLGRDLEIVD